MSKGEDVKKTGKRKLTLSKETIVNLEAGKLAGAAGATHQLPAFSDLWEKTTCV
ncbi:MAG TPA: class I lanthipeptide [Thermoanaerobaculia bacterium]|nr:class I lanthipeptide [Thermoanaerobaculia bacterium]